MQGPMVAKQGLAWDIVEYYDSPDGAADACEEWKRRFSRRELPTEITEYRTAEKDMPLVILLYGAQLVGSKNEGRELSSSQRCRWTEIKFWTLWKVIYLRDGRWCRWAEGSSSR